MPVFSSFLKKSYLSTLPEGSLSDLSSPMTVLSHAKPLIFFHSIIIRNTMNVFLTIVFLIIMDAILAYSF
jgi:hypothetical protein